jgi:hypothetical protein
MPVFQKQTLPHHQVTAIRSTAASPSQAFPDCGWRWQSLPLVVAIPGLLPVENVIVQIL